MKLTRKKAIELSIELWTWLAETGKEKHEWPKWRDNGGEHDDVVFDCFLCKYAGRKQGDDCETCHPCPYFKHYGVACCDAEDSPYNNWEDIVGEDDEETKMYAALFLEELKAIK